MATVIRFSRHGSKKKPVYRMVVQNHTAPRDGRFIEHIGNLNPVKGPESLVIKRDRLEYWLSVGAQMSDSVRTTLKPKMKEWQIGNMAPKVAKAPKAPKAPKEAKAKKAAPAARKPAAKKKEAEKEASKN